MWCGILGTWKFHVLLVTEFERCSGLRKSPGAEVDTTDNSIRRPICRYCVWYGNMLGLLSFSE